MISDFPDPSSLPGGTKTGLPSDSTSYFNLWKVAENVYRQCVKGQGKTGWQPTGMKQILSLLSITVMTSLLQRSHGYWSTRFMTNLVRVHG